MHYIVLQQLRRHTVERDQVEALQLRSLGRERCIEEIKHSTTLFGFRSIRVEVFVLFIHAVQISILNIARSTRKFDQYHLGRDLIVDISTIAEPANRKERMGCYGRK